MRPTINTKSKYAAVFNLLWYSQQEFAFLKRYT